MESVSMQNKRKRGHNAPDLTGRTYGELTVLERVSNRGRQSLLEMPVQLRDYNDRHGP